MVDDVGLPNTTRETGAEGTARVARKTGALGKGSTLSLRPDGIAIGLGGAGDGLSHTRFLNRAPTIGKALAVRVSHKACLAASQGKVSVEGGGPVCVSRCFRGAPPPLASIRDERGPPASLLAVSEGRP